MKKIRVLQVLSEPFENGGQELFICNIYRNINKEKIQFDFIAPYTGKNEKLKNEIINQGGRFYPIKVDFTKKKLYHRVIFFKKLRELLKQNDYEIVHINSVSLLGFLLGSIIANQDKVKKIIVHSHNDGKLTFKYKILKKYSDRILMKYPIHYFACSENAAKWKFPNRVIDENRYLVIKNGIDTRKFKFDEETRKQYRKQLKIEEKIVMGHVGRFEEQKNHDFIIEVFSEIVKQNENTILILIGEGSLKQKIIQKVKKMNLDKYVIFMNTRNDINKLLSAMDCFIFPSIYEGLGIAVIEAQASGLPIICSDKLPEEVQITDIIQKNSLTLGRMKWANLILKKCNEINQNKRLEYYKLVKQKGYDINNVAVELEEFYINLCKGEL